MKLSRVGVVGATAALAVLGLSVPAFAHVSVASEGEAAKGGYAVLDFKVPNERDKASTTKLEVDFPYQQHPLTSVAPQPVPGWTIKITRSRLATPLKSEGGTVDEAVSRVTWTADGDGIEPGYFQKFPVSVGKLPEDADSLTFKALQTYSNHEIVRWIEVQQKGRPEPDNPAPVLQLTAPPAEDGAGGAQAAGSRAQEGKTGTGASTTAAADDSGGSDTTARVLGVVGIVVGVLGVAFGVLAGRRRTN
ncbi:membrane protein [Streptomyces sulfonofaciens]|uniref:Membrane protein n=1 Tax=Streptomyces sulfonofaciens TaxID=68272 RepID=A0A919FP30_9ACTN|nr:YcnI family protein [Streptomyces sulfonofaciens]GHH69952.1 membrane protein [Streptomyces sulfonofaciens]